MLYVLWQFAKSCTNLRSGNLMIPKPASEIPQTAEVPSTNPGTRKPGKKGKPMEPGKTLTAQFVFFWKFHHQRWLWPSNLFDTDYLKTNPDTTAAKFSKVFQSLDDETKKVSAVDFNRLSTYSDWLICPPTEVRWSVAAEKGRGLQ